MTETERPRVLTGHTNVREAEDFDSIYIQGVPPWDIGRSQPAFAELAERGLLAGRVLDAGCGTGEHALMAAALGLEATGFDVAATAIAIANTKARDRGLEARFLQLNALVLASLGMARPLLLLVGADAPCRGARETVCRASGVAGPSAPLATGAARTREPGRRQRRRRSRTQPAHS